MMLQGAWTFIAPEICKESVFFRFVLVSSIMFDLLQGPESHPSSLPLHTAVPFQVPVIGRVQLELDGLQISARANAVHRQIVQCEPVPCAALQAGVQILESDDLKSIIAWNGE